MGPPPWVYFGDAASQRVHLSAHHEDDGRFDQFWQMEGQMSVLGFGRKSRCCDKWLTATAARLRVWLIETGVHEKVTRLIEGAVRDLIISNGTVAKQR